MTIKIYGHPFASFAWKAFIAAYERDVPFELCMVDPDHPENSARIADLSPTGQFPALVDGDRHVTQSNSVIEYLDRFGDAAPMIPNDRDAALDARMLAYIFDSYVSVPVQHIVGEALRPQDQQDQRRVTEAKVKLDKSYSWLSTRIGDSWASGNGFSIADCAAAPALFYADWVHPIPSGALKAYRARVLQHPSVARVVDEARPYRSFFPLGAPDRD
ncbi:MAG TPA: glutathione S-transferase family protein [Gammaproteobacteria bacterium]|nr:glutathione S-transferase family protein [Gammaproteobacteria bacterium]